MIDKQTGNHSERPDGDTPELVEHTHHGADEFDRHEGASFSDEDRVTLRHVAAALAGLVMVALMLIAISVSEEDTTTVESRDAVHHHEERGSGDGTQSDPAGSLRHQQYGFLGPHRGVRELHAEAARRDVAHRTPDAHSG